MNKEIEVQTFNMGRDAVFLVTGGTAHIGAVATAYKSESGFIRVNTQSLPGHREGELAAELAKTASHMLDRTVVVLVGIHLEQPSKQDIAHIVEEARRRMMEVLNSFH